MVFSEQKTKIYTLALDLTNDEAAARQVASQVFERLKGEMLHRSPEAIDRLIHRLTYDAALPILLEKTADKCDEVEACCTWLGQQPKNSAIC